MSSSGIGQAAGELLKEMNKAQQEMQQQQGAQESQQAQSFQKVLEQNQTQQVGEVKGVTDTQQIEAANKAQNILTQARLEATNPTTRVGEAASAENSKLTKMLDGLLQGQDKMTEIVDLAMSGRQFSPPELLVMQAGIFRFSQELELAGKVVEKATSGVKQTLNTQV
jgi:hypothetical protein